MPKQAGLHNRTGRRNLQTALRKLSMLSHPSDPMILPVAKG